MTTSDNTPRDDVPEADLAEQQTPIYEPADEDGPDLTGLTAAGTDADAADVIDQSRTVGLPTEDDEWQR